MNKTLIGNCINCKHWSVNNAYVYNFGDCSFLSGKIINKKEQYPNTEKTGIESYPLCEHDGDGFHYQTKGWFGCVNFEDK